MLLAYAESWATAAESPFIDGQRLQIFDRDAAWLISTDQDGATFTNTGESEFWNQECFWSHRTALKWLLQVCPATHEIFGIGETAGGRPTFRVPKLERANAFVSEKFAGLPTAGVQAFQETDMGDTPLSKYLHDLVDEDVPYLPISFGHERHFHDLISHWLGAATIEAQSFVVFKALCNDALSFWEDDPRWPNKQYPAALAKGFDKFTASQHRRTMSSYTSGEGYLLSQCLEYVSLWHREKLSRAVEIVRDFGMDVKNVASVQSIIVPWEIENLPTYYDQVAERLR
jgi:catechol 2,3-dioxygenase-like lactoylglutathione lyase family enzyme